MFLSHLSLVNFRNYQHLDLTLPGPVVLFQGDNGQGKTNLLEAVYFLATTRSLRAGSDRELIHWGALQEPIPFARVEGTVRRSHGDLRVEIVIRADRPDRRQPILEAGQQHAELTKRIKVNGIVRRALDLIGQINVVMFSPQDIDLVAGPPSLRRRYLDIANCQVDHRYCRALQQYNRVLTQRNHLLKQIRESRQPPETLEFWSDELAKNGSYVLARRLASIAALNDRIGAHFKRLTGTGKQLRIAYQSTVEEALSRYGMPEPAGAAAPEPAGDEAERQVEVFREALRLYRRRETLQGVSLVGPHRDELVFVADGIDMNVYGSRGEQRAVALALRLAEAEFMQAATGEAPILLLDDVMSELDPQRRALVMEALGVSGQTLMTATDLETFSSQFLAQAAVFHVDQARAGPVERVR